MLIERKRYVVMRNNRTEIWCGLARHFYFKSVSEIGDSPIKTYLSSSKAKSSCSSWNKDFEVVEVVETLSIL